MTQREIKELSSIVAEYSVDDYQAGAVLTKIQNERGQWHDVIDVTIVHAPTKERIDFLHRDSPTQFKGKMKTAFEALQRKVKEREDDKKNENSL